MDSERKEVGEEEGPFRFYFRTAMGLYQTHFPSLNLPSLGMMRPLE